MAIKNTEKNRSLRARVQPESDDVNVSNEDAEDIDAPLDAPRPAHVVIRSEGQRLLLGVTDSLSTIGKAVGASKQAVSTWRTGLYVPEPPYRRELQRRYQIPPSAWDGLADGEVPDEGEDEDEAPATAADQLDHLLKEYRKQLKRGDLSSRERVQYIEGLSRTIFQKAKLEKERELLEDRVIREHPKWRRLKRAIIDSLLPHPAAARAVEEAITRLIGEDEANQDVDV
jgi:hypothetical protein